MSPKGATREIARRGRRVALDLAALLKRGQRMPRLPDLVRARVLARAQKTIAKAQETR